MRLCHQIFFFLNNFVVLLFLFGGVLTAEKYMNTFFSCDGELIPVYPCLNRIDGFCLFDNGCFKPGDYIFAQLQKYRGKVYFRYFIVDIEQLQKIMMQYNEPRFYSVVVCEQRLMYFDIDMLLYGKEVEYASRVEDLVVFFVSKLLQGLMDVNVDNMLVWNGGRMKSNGRYRVSLHVVIPSCTLHYKKIKGVAEKLKYYLQFISSRLGDAVDLTVYHRIQCWRLPHNGNNDNGAILKLDRGCKLSISDQLRINCLVSNEYDIDWVKEIKNQEQFRWHRMNNFSRDVSVAVFNRGDKEYKVKNLRCLWTKGQTRSYGFYVYIISEYFKWVEIRCCGGRCPVIRKSFSRVKQCWLFVNLEDVLDEQIIELIDMSIYKYSVFLSMGVNDDGRYLCNANSIVFNPSDRYKLSLFLMNYITCVQCQCIPSRIIIQIRSTNYVYLYCQHCRRYFSQFNSISI